VEGGGVGQVPLRAAHPAGAGAHAAELRANPLRWVGLRQGHPAPQVGADILLQLAVPGDRVQASVLGIEGSENVLRHAAVAGVGGG